MQAVLLAGGKSSRLHPFAQDGTHKSMLKVLGKPILEHTIDGLKKVGVEKIIIVVGAENAIEEYFGDGKSFGVSITYVVQKEPLGMGNALLLSEKYLEDQFLLTHAHHIDVYPYVEELFSQKNNGQALILAQVRSDPWKYGVLKVQDDKVVEIVEKPQKGKESSNLCIVGMYILPKVFLETLKKTPEEHYQLETALSQFAKDNTVKVVEVQGETVTLKYPWDLLKVKDYLLKSIKKSLGKSVAIAKSAEIIGEVCIGDDTTIMEGAKIKGPCYIGNNVTIGNNAILRSGVVVGDDCVIGANMEVKNALFFDEVTTHSGFIGDSVIGQKCKIAGQFCTANVRLDREAVKVTVKNEKIDSGLKSLGVFMGDGVAVGVNVSVMPGVTIGKNAIIGPSTTILRNVDNDTKYYTKFEEVVEVKNGDKK